jgi:hypothetical protein
MNTKTCPTCGFLLSDKVVVIDKEKWDRLVELIDSESHGNINPWPEIRGIIQEVEK